MSTLVSEFTLREIRAVPRVRPRATPAARFWPKVQKTPVCWLWLGARTSTGYGSFRDGEGRSVKAHRMAYELSIGAIPTGLTIDHLCGNILCVNPTHLEAVTQQVNILRAPRGLAARNARKTHCDRGHEFTPENTGKHIYGRYCRECSRITRRARRLERRLALSLLLETSPPLPREG